MKKFYLFFKFVLLTSIILNTEIVVGQCQQFTAQVIGVNCRDNGTNSDPSDDFFVARVYISNDLNPNNTWSSSDGSYSNQTYTPNIFEFGPFPISGGNVSISITDDQDECMKIVNLIAPPPCSTPPVACPDWNTCISLIASDGCTHVFSIDVSGDDVFSNQSNGYAIHLLQMNFSLQGEGRIVSADYYSQESYYSLNSINLSHTVNSVNISYFNPISPIHGYGLVGNNIVTVVVESEDLPSCLTMSRNGTNVVLNVESGQSCFVTGLCTPIEICETGETISGRITGYSGLLTNCPETVNLGIAGSDVSIVGPNGNCSAISGIDGTYSCSLCPEGPYEICVETVCEEPCGVTDLDLIIMRKILLGHLPWVSYFPIIGDINNNGVVTTIDILLLGQAAFKNDTTYVKNWCRFIPVTDYQSLPNTIYYDNPNVYTELDNCLTINKYQEPSVSTDFIRFMVGDYNGSCTDCVHGDNKGNFKYESPNISNNKTPLRIQSLNPGLLNIGIPQDDKFYGLTLHLALPEGTLINNVRSLLPNIDYAIKHNELHIFWFDISENSLGYKNRGIDNLINIDYSGETPYLADGENLLLSETQDISHLQCSKNLSLRSTKYSSVIINNVEYNLLGNESIIQYELYDIMGRKHKSGQIDLKNQNNLFLDQESFFGIYFLRLYNKENDFTKKILLSTNYE